MKSVMVKVFLSVLMMNLAPSAYAEGGRCHTPNSPKKGLKSVHNRLQRQEEKIDRALEKGKITAEEAAELKAGVSAIRTEKNSMLEDGKITSEERTQLQSELNASKSAIQSAVKAN